MSFLGDEIPIIRGSALEGAGDAIVRIWMRRSMRVSRKLIRSGGQNTYRTPKRETGQAVPDAGGGCVLDQGSRDGGDGSRLSVVSVRTGEEIDIVGSAVIHVKVDSGDGRGDVPEDRWTRGRRGTTSAACCAGIEPTDDIERGMVLAKPRERSRRTRRS